MIRHPAPSCALSLLLLLSACRQSDPKDPSTAPPPAGDALAGKTELEAAFAVAFPHGATVQVGDTKLTYQAKQLVPVSSDIEALIAEGSAEDACHACDGRLKIVYLSHAGGGLALVGRPAGWSMDGNGFGAPPGWSIDRASAVPLLTVKTSDTEQGCETNTINVFRLEPRGVKKDAAASKPAEESCAGASDDAASSDNRTDASAETDSRAAAGAGANANWNAYYRQHPDQAPGANRASPADAPSPPN